MEKSKHIMAEARRLLGDDSACEDFEDKGTGIIYDGGYFVCPECGYRIENYHISYGSMDLVTIDICEDDTTSERMHSWDFENKLCPVCFSEYCIEFDDEDLHIMCVHNILKNRGVD